MGNLHGDIINAEYIKSEFPNEESALRYLEKIRWDGSPTCPYCNSGRNTDKGSRKGLRRCYNRRCRWQFTAKHGTIFEKTLVPLHKWLLAAYFVMRPEGTSAVALGDDIGVTPATAWHMMHRICTAMGRHTRSMVLNGIVECDCTVFGGLEEYKHSKKRLFTGGGYGGKLGVFCMVERGEHGRAITLVVPSKPAENINGQPITSPDFSKEFLHGAIRRHVDAGSIICTDGSNKYSDLLKNGLARLHFTVNRSGREFLAMVGHPEMKLAHTNTARARIKIMKACHLNLRGWEPKYFQHYLYAADFRWNETKAFKMDKNGELVFLRRTPTTGALDAFVKGCFNNTLPLSELKRLNQPDKEQ